MCVTKIYSMNTLIIIIVIFVVVVVLVVIDTFMILDITWKTRADSHLLFISHPLKSKALLVTFDFHSGKCRIPPKQNIRGVLKVAVGLRDEAASCLLVVKFDKQPLCRTW